jgi:hypothetical protein
MHDFIAFTWSITILKGILVSLLIWLVTTGITFLFIASKTHERIGKWIILLTKILYSVYKSEFFDIFSNNS